MNAKQWYQRRERSFMGCYASRPNTLITNTSQDPSFSHSSSSLSSSPVAGALSLPTPPVHHLPLQKGDTHHLVSLTSTTYGSLLLIDLQNPNLTAQDRSPANRRDSLSPDSVINAWELMDGLDDGDFDAGAVSKRNAVAFDGSVKSLNKPSSFQYLGSDVSSKKLLGAFESAKSAPSSKPLWQHLSEEALLAKMDPNVAASYRRALSSRQLSFDQPKIVKHVTTSPPENPQKPNSSFSLPETEDRIVLYFTSLRGIRKTYEDCCSVRMIFRGLRVPVDERDTSMDSAYRKELQNVLGAKAVTLPQVFIRGKHIGGADEIRQLNEAGEMTKLLEGLPVRDPGFVCKSCGDARFVPCPNCCGSRKIFEEEKGQLRRCPDCNENGLIRCRGCCS